MLDVIARVLAHMPYQLLPQYLPMILEHKSTRDFISAITRSKPSARMNAGKSPAGAGMRGSG
jgi:hypothetical protein